MGSLEERLKGAERDVEEFLKTLGLILLPPATSVASLYLGLMYGVAGALLPPTIVSIPMLYYLWKREKLALEILMKPFRYRKLEEVVEEYKRMLEEQKKGKR
jgi:hypothetical protein